MMRCPYHHTLLAWSIVLLALGNRDAGVSSRAVAVGQPPFPTKAACDAALPQIVQYALLHPAEAVADPERATLTALPGNRVLVRYTDGERMVLQLLCQEAAR